MPYRPLPEGLTIKKSNIEGLGLFTDKPIPAGKVIGITHRFINDEILRTPLGGFYNHSDTPNCYSNIQSFSAVIIAKRDIEAGEELTTFYQIEPLK